MSSTNIADWDLSYIDDNGTYVGGIKYETDSVIMVAPAKANSDRYTNLVDAYDSAKSLTPGGNSLSATNRAVVIIPPGTYEAGDVSFEIDANYVDFVAMVPEAPNQHKIANKYDDDSDPTVQINGVANYKPTATVLQGNGEEVVLINSSVDDIRMIGFTVYNYKDSGDFPIYSAFRCKNLSGVENSFFEKMYFHANYYNVLGYTIVPEYDVFAKNVAGTWVDCVGHDFFWRCAYTSQFDTYFLATMRNCSAGLRSIGGDYDTNSAFTHLFGESKLENCVVTRQGFGGCGTWGIGSTSDAIFIDCETDSGGFGLSAVAGGTFIRCKGGRCSFGGQYANDPIFTGRFTGVAIDCEGGEGSFGGSDFTPWSGGLKGKCQGTLIRCTQGDRDNFFGGVGIELEGARLEGCYIPGGSGDGTGFSTLTLLDGNCEVTYCTILNQSGDTAGSPIGADSAQNVIAMHNVFNNGTTFATGLNANVTNLATTPSNGILP